jgi:hypothetical protein
VILITLRGLRSFYFERYIEGPIPEPMAMLRTITGSNKKKLEISMILEGLVKDEVT